MATIEHDGKERELGRFVMGLGWPSDKYGFAVVVAEEFFSRSGEKIRHIHLMEEICDVPLMNDLLIQSSELLRKIQVERKIDVEAVFARVDEHIEDQFLTWKLTHREDFWITRAPNSNKQGLISYHAGLLIERGRQKNLHLNLSPAFTMANKIYELQNTDVSQAKDRDFPAIAALGYAVAYLNNFEAHEPAEFVVKAPGKKDLGRSSWTGY